MTIRSEIWTTNIHSLGFQDIRECVVLWRLISWSLGCILPRWRRFGKNMTFISLCFIGFVLIGDNRTRHIAKKWATWEVMQPVGWRYCVAKSMLQPTVHTAKCNKKCSMLFTPPQQTKCMCFLLWWRKICNLTINYHLAPIFTCTAHVHQGSPELWKPWPHAQP